MPQTISVIPGREFEFKKMLTDVIEASLLTTNSETSDAQSDSSDGETSKTHIIDRGRAYISTVVEYIQDVGFKYPVDSCQVAVNKFLRPAVHRSGKTAKIDDVVFVGLSKKVYADPLALALTEAYPKTIIGVVVNGESMPFKAAASVLRAVFSWRAEDFPVNALVLAEEGQPPYSLMIPRIKNAWIEIPASVLNGLQGGSKPTSLDISSIMSISPSGTQYGPQSKNSSQKGVMGEKYVFKLLQESLTYSVNKVSQKARAADIEVVTPHGRVCVETKNYSVSVPEKEVVKFRRDLGARAANVGVFISLSSNIVGMRGRIAAKMEVIPLETRAIPIVYICSDHPDVIIAGVELAIYLSTLVPKMVKNPYIDELSVYSSQLEENADLLEDALARLGNLFSDIVTGMGDVKIRLSAPLRDQRQLIRTYREMQYEDKVVSRVWELILERYDIPEEMKKMLNDVIDVLKTSVLDNIQETSQWFFYKSKVKYLRTGATISFLKNNIEVGATIANCLDVAGDVLCRHVGMARVSSSTFSLVLDVSTLPDIFLLLL